MWKRIELHNHTIESDGLMTVKELVSYLNDQNIHAFSLTDHNTVSGWPALPEACSGLPETMEFIKGFELTSYYGHMLCQNLAFSIPWDDIDETCADTLIRRVHAAGGLAGPAHPFSVPAPFSNGMRWTMRIRDYNLVDFVEIINNAHSMEPDNREAVLWWAKLILSGFSIAPVSGLDLHRPVCMDGFYTTYIQVKEEDLTLPLSIQLDHAVRSCCTCVTRGPVPDWRLGEEGISLFLCNPEGETETGIVPSDSGSPALGIPPVSQSPALICQIRTADQTAEFPMKAGTCFIPFTSLHSPLKAAVFLIFEEKPEMERLVAAARPLLTQQGI